MPIKDNSNKITEKAEMIFQDFGVGFALAGLVNPVFSIFSPICNLISLPFAAHNRALANKQMNTIKEEFNKLETRFDRFERLTEEQKDTFLLNEYKFLDYALKEKMREKISAYSKILSMGINSGIIFEEDDLFDIQIDIINALRKEDIVLCNWLITFTKSETDAPFAYEFSIDELEAFIVNRSSEEQTINRYALKHLINLGLVDERLTTSAEVNDSHAIVFSDNVIARYSLTQRFRMVYQIIMS